MMDHERYNKGIFRHTSYLKINMTYDVHYKNRPNEEMKCSLTKKVIDKDRKKSDKMSKSL